MCNKLISLFKRSPFCFRLNTVIVVEVDAFGYDEVVKWAKIKAYRIRNRRTCYPDNRCNRCSDNGNQMVVGTKEGRKPLPLARIGIFIVL